MLHPLLGYEKALIANVIHKPGIVWRGSGFVNSISKGGVMRQQNDTLVAALFGMIRHLFNSGYALICPQVSLRAAPADRSS